MITLDIKFIVPKDKLKEVNNTLNHLLITKYNYPMYYENNLQYIQTNPFIITKEKYEEIKYATEKITEVFNIVSKVFRYEQPFLQELFVTNDERYLYTISKTLKFDKYITLYGRYDWGVDAEGNLKLFEFNADTPAGLCEASFVSTFLQEQLKLDNLFNPNEKLLKYITNTMDRYIIHNLGLRKEYNMTFACVKMAPEDFFNVKVLYDYYRSNSVLRSKLKMDFVDMSELSVKMNKNNEPSHLCTPTLEHVDIFFRFYPLEWFLDNNDYPVCGDIFHLIADGKLLTVNPPHSMAVHSKGVLALLYQIMIQAKSTKQILFTEEHLDVMEKYLLPTFLEMPSDGKYVGKPFFDREGANIKIFNQDNFNPTYLEKDYVYQEKMELKKVSFYSHDKNKVKKVNGRVVLSSYAIGNEFGGILTRIGNEITDSDAYFFPTYVAE